MKKSESNFNNLPEFSPKDLFLSDLFFIDLEDALPGSLLPGSTEPIAFNGQKITPLIPINPILLDYFTPEDLNSKIKFQPFRSGNDSMIKVILDLPLSGTRDDGTPENFTKDYPLKEENALLELPVLEVWPNFLTKSQQENEQDKTWQEYYAFYYDGEHGDDTFQVKLHETKEFKEFQERRGSFQLARMEEFPSGVKCYRGKQKKLIGLILLPTPEEIDLRDSWKVGVDFNSKLTNIYINKNNYAEPLPIKNLLLNVTDVDQARRLTVLFEYFIPENFIPESKPLPLSTVLTTRGSKTRETNQIRPIFDGRIYIPDNFRFRPQEDWVKTNLTWSNNNLIYIQLFIKNLVLYISAIAAENGVKNIQWCISYPSTFTFSVQITYIETWEKIINEFRNKTGLNYSFPTVQDLKYYRSEHLAFAQYFKDYERDILIKTSCIYLLDNTSNISIWEKNKLVHQCSVQLGIRDLFSQFLSLNPQFFIKRFGVNAHKWERLNGVAFNNKLDVWLRLEGEEWLRETKFQVEEEEDFQGFTRLTAIGIAGLYYYVGILLKTLYEEEKYSRNEITKVYLGGNGSPLLNWLTEAGKFDQNSEVNKLLSWMLSKGSGFDDIGITTKLSKNPGDEVACGLVLHDTLIEDRDRRDKNPLIMGESCKINNQQIDAQSCLYLEEKNIKEFQIPQPVNLAKFLYEFHVALRELKIEGITGLPNYQLSPKLDKNRKLWREVKKEITNLLIILLEPNKKNPGSIRLEPPFIISLKALLNVLSKQWAGK